MSRIARAAELAKRVLGTDRGARNKELMQQMRMERMVPGRAQNLAETVLKTPSPRSGGLSNAAKALGASTLAEDIAMAALGAGSVGAGAYMLKDVPPEELGKMGAQLRMSFDEMLQKIQNTAQDATTVPQAYFMQMQQGYEAEKLRQEALQNIQEFGDPMGEPVEMPPTIEEQAIKPVSVFMAEGGLAMSDNEPRFETRSPEGQIFSIDAQIENLMKSYNMLVNANEFGRAQEVADQIDQLQQQKIGIQAQNDPFIMQSGPLTDLSSKIGPMMGTLGAMGQSARTISNRDREAISSLLESISE
tara:strand:- start:395 stop:1303 length:909 start_codon:yes stop_codon:yes gene_type:complete